MNDYMKVVLYCACTDGWGWLSRKH